VSTRAIRGRGGSFPWGLLYLFFSRGPAIANHGAEHCNHHKSDTSKSRPPHLGYGGVPAPCPPYRRSATLHPQYVRHAPPPYQRTGGPLSGALTALATLSPTTSALVQPNLAARIRHRRYRTASTAPPWAASAATPIGRGATFLCLNNPDINGENAPSPQAPMRFVEPLCLSCWIWFLCLSYCVCSS
jgi:hypothetical protein